MRGACAAWVALWLVVAFVPTVPGRDLLGCLAARSARARVIRALAWLVVRLRWMVVPARLAAAAASFVYLSVFGGSSPWPGRRRAAAPDLVSGR